jgi:hypothetical protein
VGCVIRPPGCPLLRSCPPGRPAAAASSFTSLRRAPYRLRSGHHRLLHAQVLRFSNGAGVSRPGCRVSDSRKCPPRSRPGGGLGEARPGGHGGNRTPGCCPGTRHPQATHELRPHRRPKTDPRHLRALLRRAHRAAGGGARRGEGLSRAPCSRNSATSASSACAIRRTSAAPASALTEFALALAEIARGSMSLAGAVAMQSLMGTKFLHMLGNADILERLFKPALRGEKIGAICMTEPNAGSDLDAIATTAKKVDGGYVINGQKTWITSAPVADFFTVFAKAGEEKKLTIFLVERISRVSSSAARSTRWASGRCRPRKSPSTNASSPTATACRRRKATARPPAQDAGRDPHHHRRHGARRRAGRARRGGALRRRAQAVRQGRSTASRRSR